MNQLSGSNTGRNKQDRANLQASNAENSKIERLFSMSDDGVILTIGGRAKFVRKKLQLSQQEIAAEIGISARSWQKLERDEGTVNSDIILAFSRVEINPGWILTGLGPMAMDDKSDLKYDATATILHVEILASIGAIVTDYMVENPASGVDLEYLLKVTGDAYNRLIERADDPADVDELKALLPWLKRQLEKSLVSK